MEDEAKKNLRDRQVTSCDSVHKLLWAKSNPFKQLLAHMLDAGCCAKAFLTAASSRAFLDYLAEQWNCDDYTAASFTAYLAAMHDIGKAMPQFQRQDETQFARLIENGLESLFHQYDNNPIRHEYYSARIATRIWKGRGINHSLFKPYACILSLHHQRIEESVAVKPIPEAWQRIQTELEQEIRSSFQAPDQLLPPSHMDAICIVLTGIIILSDWVASSGPFDGLPVATGDDLAARYKIADQALRRFGLISNNESGQIDSFHSMWPQIQSPRDIQKKCEQLNPEAPITIIEAPMGEGKTEAALYMAERMCRAWHKRGLYIALPTQATSNQMYGRTQSMLDTIGGSHARLLHGTAFLYREEQAVNSEDAYDAERWLGSSRMGLLDDNGVGTVDQAMAGVLIARFSVLRLLGLTNKVLIVDELHAYDAYMSGIIRVLFSWCRALRIPVLLLSATLQESQRKAYLSCYTEHDLLPELSSAYPLITQIDQAGQLIQIKAEATLRTTYVFSPVFFGQNAESIAQYAVQQVQKGGCYCVLVNTIKRAQDIYQAILALKDSETETMLFHARFSVGRREEIERECLSKFGKAPEANRPAKAILVATQVVEQSLDLDFDGMMTELAPIDLLLQRAGRVHRHRNRRRPDGMKQPVIKVILPDENAVNDPEKRYGSSGYVYAPFLLINTEFLINEGLCVDVPGDIRQVISKVYDHITPDNMSSWHNMAFHQQLMQANARGISFPEPQDDVFFPAETHSEFIRLEVDDGFEPAARASTRLGEPTIRVAFSSPELLEAAKAGKLTKEQQRNIYLSSVSLSARHFPQGSLESGVLFKIEKGVLRGSFLSDRCDIIEFGNKKLVNDPILGVLWKE